MTRARESVDRTADVVLIIGAGLAGWLAALAAKAAMPSNTQVIVVASATRPVIGVGESSTGAFTQFLIDHDIATQDFVRAAGATFKLGVELVGWRRSGHSVFAPLDNPDAMVGFQPYEGTCLSQHAALADGCAVAQAHLHYWLARRNRVPAKCTEGEIDLLGTHAWHFDAGRAADFIARCARERGVRLIEGDVATLSRNANGEIEAVILRDGRNLFADFVIDCSGQHRVLIDSDRPDWTSLASILPADRAVAGTMPQTGIPEPSTRAVAKAAGWIWEIPAAGRVGVGYVHASAHVDEEEAWRTLARHAGADFRPGPCIRFEPGFRRAPWQANGVAVGMAAGFLEPLQATTLHLTVIQIRWVVAALCAIAAGAPGGSWAARYNAWMVEYQQDLADFILLHYAGTRGGSFWQSAGDRARSCALFQSVLEFNFGAGGGLLRGRSGALSPNLVLPVAGGLGLLRATPPALSSAQRRAARAMRALHREYAGAALDHAEALGLLGSEPNESWNTRMGDMTCTTPPISLRSSSTCIRSTRNSLPARAMKPTSSAIPN